MRFEKDVLEISLALMSHEKERFKILNNGIVAQISELPLSVNIVKREEELIKFSQQNNFWSTATDETLEPLIEKLAPLMKFREKDTGGSGPVLLDLKDKVKTKEFVEFGPQNEAVSISRYREMVENQIMELTKNNPILLKIKKGEQISAEETNELTQTLYDSHPHITENLLQVVYQNKKARFVQFIRHILGIEILTSFSDTVAKAFYQFIKEHTDLNSRQLEFLKLLKDFIIEREKVEKRDLIQSPFTVLHPQGVRGVFSPALINDILALTKELAA